MSTPINDFEIPAEVRVKLGKAHSRRFRRLEDKIPAVIYGSGKAPVSLLLDHNQFSRRLQNDAIYSHILNVVIDGQKEQAVLKAMQRHPYKKKILHVDFLRVSATEKLTMRVPIHFSGEDIAPGVKMAGGVISHHMIDIEIVCLPADLPESINIDISKMELGQSINVQEITLPKGVELSAHFQLAAHNFHVVSIHAPTAAKEEPAATPAAAPAADASAGAAKKSD